MATGVQVHEGAAACGYGFQTGQRFTIEGDPMGRVYVCEDRGGGPFYWVDIFWGDPEAARLWLAQVGTQARLRLLE